MADYVVLLPGTGLLGQNLPGTGTGLKDIDGDGVNDVSLAIFDPFGAVDASGAFGLGVAGGGAPAWRRAADLIVVGDGTGRDEAYAGVFAGFRGELNNSDDNWSKVNFSSGDGWVQWRFGADVNTLIPLLFVREAEGVDFSAAQAFRAAYNTAPTGTVTITGTATQGQTLTAANTLADVDGIPGAITYQWKADGSDITGATGNTLLLTQAQVGKVITVVASYTDGFGRAESVPSAPTPPIANINDAPTGTVTITGTTTQGQPLTANSALVDDDGFGSLTYQWEQSSDGTTWSDITEATANILILSQAQVNQLVRVRVSYLDGGKTLESVVSNATSPVVNINDASTGTVTITGTATQGETLTATNTLADVDGIPGAIAYQWQADGTDIAGATNNALLLTQAQVGKAITVTAIYTDGFGVPEAVTSAPTTPVANVNDAPTGTVTITGTATQGQTLSASNNLADLDGLGPITYTWFANGTSTGVTGNTYTLAQADVGKVFTVIATYTDGLGTPEAVTSASTSAIAPIPPVSVPPVIPPPLPPTPNQIIALDNQLLSVLGSSPTHLTATLAGQGAASVLDIAMIRVDDAAGRIDGLLPSDGGYIAAALGRATTLMSALKAGDFVGQFGQRRVPVAPGQFFQFALIQGGTLDDLKRGGAGQIFFATGAANGNGQSGVQYTPTATGLTMDFTLPGSASPAVTLQLGLDSTPASLGSQSQGLTAQSELLDLTGLAGPTATLAFEVFREASFNNVVGFYTVEDTQGRVRDALTGTLLSPGEAGYQQAALANRVVSNLAGQNGQTLTYSATVATGQLLSTFLVVNGPLDALLDATPANDPTVFFNYIAANADGQDHVRLLGDNTFGFEDILGGGDQDFNDVIVKVAVT